MGRPPPFGYGFFSWVIDVVCKMAHKYVENGLENLFT